MSVDPETARRRVSSLENPVRVIGGGMTGLTVALRLAQHGYRVAVHERDPYLGGLSAETALAGVPVERFYHCVLPGDSALLALLDELGLKESVHWARTRTGFLHGGTLLEMTTTRDFFRFSALTRVDRVRLAWTLLYCALLNDWQRLDEQPLGEFLLRHGGRRMFESLWEPLLLSKLGPGYNRFAAPFIWATVKRMLSARRAKGRSEKLGFVQGRYGKVFTALRRKIEAAGGEVCGDQMVQAVSRGRGDASPWTLRVNDRELGAAGLVLCVPAPVAAAWLTDISPEAARTIGGVEYLGVVCETLLLRRSLTPYYILNLIDRPMPFTAVIETSNLAGTGEFSGNTLVYLPRYCTQDAPAWSADDGSLHAENLAGLLKVTPAFDPSDVVAWRIGRARFVQPIHRVGGAKEALPVHIAPGLAWLSTAHIRPWPVFNDEVVRLVDRNLARVVATLEET